MKPFVGCVVKDIKLLKRFTTTKYQLHHYVLLTENGGPENGGPKQTNACNLNGVPVKHLNRFLLIYY